MYLEPTIKLLPFVYDRYLTIAIFLIAIYDTNFFLLNNIISKRFNNQLDSFKSAITQYKYSILIYEMIKIMFSVTTLYYWDNFLIYKQNNIIAIYLITFHISANIILKLLYKIVAVHKSYKLQLDLIDIDFTQYQHAVTTNKVLLKNRHDYMHHLSCIHGLMHYQAFDEGKTYIENILTEQTTQLEFLISDPVLNAVISRRKNKALEVLDNIHFSVHPFEVISVCTSELGIIIGNVLDNALEASSMTFEKSLIFEIYKDAHMIFIKVINPCDPSSDFLKKSFKKGSSSKNEKEHHGFGLRIIQDRIDLLGGDIQYYRDNDTIVTFIRIDDPATEAL